MAADTGSATLPVVLTICQTNPVTGECLQAPAPSVTTTIANGATPTFGIFVQGRGSRGLQPGGEPGVRALPRGRARGYRAGRHQRGG